MVPSVNATSSSSSTSAGSSSNQDEHGNASETTTEFVPPFTIHPAHFLLGSSLPLFAGAYAGYRKQIKSAAEEVAAGTTASGASACPEAAEAAALRKAVAEAPIVAARALVLGSVLSVGGVALFCGSIFYASGYASVNEAVVGLRRWAPMKRQQFEEWIGLREYVPPSQQHEDMVATRNMSEDDEIEYLRKKYFPTTDDEKQQS